jgi:pantoate--beta-alanine ligase
MKTPLLTTISEMTGFSQQARSGGDTLALVPTMGALHEGHMSLVRRARQDSDTVVVSIFVNPAQFGPEEDFARYPRQLEKDLEILSSAEVDAAFAPIVNELYPEGFGTWVEPGEIAASFEGASRPGHFRGVVTVVLKLFNIVQPHHAYFGQKDFQQIQVVRSMIEDFNLSVRLVACPTVREPDGLAVSSRNAYLSASDRRAALVLNRCLRQGEELAHTGENDARRLLEEMRKVLAAEPRVQLDYLAFVDPRRLQPVEQVSPGTVALIAARVGVVRLIDNLIFGPPGSGPERLLQLALERRY